MRLFSLLKNKNAKNATWIIVLNIGQSILSFIVSILTARYLGPSNFGLINYASSVVTFFIPIMQLGFNSVIVQELTNNPNDEGKILGTTIVGSICSSFLCITGVFIFSFVANPGEKLTIAICLLYSLMLFFKTFELFQYWFQYKLLSKYTSIISLVAYAVMAGYRIFLLVTEKNVVWFAISQSIDFLLIGILLFVTYKILGGKKLEFSFETFKRIISKSKYYILSSLMVTIFAQTDKIMLKIMVGESATGYYSVAVSFAAVASFVYCAIIDSLRPLIYQYKKEEDVEGYERNIIRLYSIIIYLSLIQSVLMTIFAPFFIKLMYGEDYAQSISALQIIVWYTTFSYYGGAKDVWLLGEGKQKYLVYINAAGAFLNIGLNFLLIPSLGVNGAALASLITQIFTNIIMVSLIKPLRYNQKLLLRALNPKTLLDMIK